MLRIIRLAPRLFAPLAILATLAFAALLLAGPAELHAVEQVPGPICGVWKKTGGCCPTSSQTLVNLWERHCKWGNQYEYYDWMCVGTCGS